MSTALTLSAVYGSLVPSERVIALLQAETDVEKVADFAKAVEAAKHIDSKNSERRNYWGELVLWSTRRLGELIRDAQNNGTLKKRGGNRRPKAHDVPLKLEEVGIGRVQSQRAQRIADIPEERIREYVQKQMESQEEITKAGLLKATAGPHVSHNSGNNEWYTPPEFIAAAKAVMGDIDLDPASSPKANETVSAKRFFTAEDDGLKQDWAGRIFLNPPYSSDLIGQFAEKFAEHAKAGDIEQGIVLVNNATETEWFGAFVSICSAVVFPRFRLKFLDNNGKPTGAPLQGQAFLYHGKHSKVFLGEFKKFGWGAAI